MDRLNTKLLLKLLKGDSKNDNIQGVSKSFLEPAHTKTLFWIHLLDDVLAYVYLLTYCFSQYRVLLLS